MKLRVSNFNPSLTKMDLEEIFEEYGRVMSVKIFKDPNPETKKSLAFVEMRSESAASQAMESLNGTDLDGYMIKVEISSDIINHSRSKAIVPPVEDLLDDDEEEDDEDIEPIKHLKDEESYEDDSYEEDEDYSDKEEEDDDDEWDD